MKNEIIMYEYIEEVKIRKYPVDIENLKLLLRNNKHKSNKDIAKELNCPITLVEHWFRKDKCFAIPLPEYWDKLKLCLGINDTSFDKSIMTFISKPSVYDMSNRLYSSYGIAPTLLAGCGDEKYIVEE